MNSNTKCNIVGILAFLGTIFVFKTMVYANFSLSSRENYPLNKCKNNSDCYDNCGNIKELIPLCDHQGNCICDCSNMTLVDAKPVPPNCAEWIPSMEHDSCSRYCSEVYQKPSKICGVVESYLYCSCVC